LRAVLRAAPYGVFTLPFNLSGQPAISLPLHWMANGLPSGVQIVAAYARQRVVEIKMSNYPRQRPHRRRPRRK
jgi:amidase